MHKHTHLTNTNFPVSSHGKRWIFAFISKLPSLLSKSFWREILPTTRTADVLYHIPLSEYIIYITVKHFIYCKVISSKYSQKEQKEEKDSWQNKTSLQQEDEPFCILNQESWEQRREPDISESQCCIKPLGLTVHSAISIQWPSQKFGQAIAVNPWDNWRCSSLEEECKETTDFLSESRQIASNLQIDEAFQLYG